MALTVYVATDNESVAPILAAIQHDIKDLKKKKLNARSLDLFKQQTRGGILLGSDDMETSMSSLGVNEMAFGEYVAVDTVVDGIDKVTAGDVLEMAREILNPEEMAVFIMGDVDGPKVRALIK